MELELIQLVETSRIWTFQAEENTLEYDWIFDAES